MKFPKTYGLNNVPMSMNGLYDYPNQVVDVPLGKDKKITMQGINYPVLGVSDTGDAKVMQPNQQNISFDGSMVREFPLKQYGQSDIVPPLDNKSAKINVQQTKGPVNQFMTRDQLLQTDTDFSMKVLQEDLDKFEKERSSLIKEMTSLMPNSGTKTNVNRYVNFIEKAAPLYYSYVYDNYPNLPDKKRQNIARAFLTQNIHEAFDGDGNPSFLYTNANNFGGRKFVGQGTINQDYVIKPTWEELTKSQYLLVEDIVNDEQNFVISPLTEEQKDEWTDGSKKTFNVNARFTKYDSFEDGIKSHVDKVINSSYYGQYFHDAFIEGDEDPDQLGYVIQQGETKYATDSEYSEKIENRYFELEPLFDFYEGTYPLRRDIKSVKKDMGVARTGQLLKNIQLYK